MKCKHEHECEACIRIEIQKHEDEIKSVQSKIDALKKKLPQQTIIINNNFQEKSIYPCPQPWYNGVQYLNASADRLKITI